MKMFAIAFGIGCLYSVVAHAGLFGPSNYDDCILKNAKDAGSNTGAALVALACRNKFPENKAAATQGAPTAANTAQPRDSGGFTDFTPGKPK